MNNYNLDPFDNTMYPVDTGVPSNVPTMEPTRHSFTGPNFLDKVFFELPPEMNNKAHQPRSRAATWDSTSFSIPPPPTSGGAISNNGGGINNDYQQQQPQNCYARDRSYSVKSDPIGTKNGNRGGSYPPRDSSSSSTVTSAAQSRPLIQVPPKSNNRITLNMASAHLPLSRKFRLTKERSEPRMMTTSATTMLGTDSGTAGGGATAPGSSVSKMMVNCPPSKAKKPMSLADAGKTVGTAPVSFGGNISKLGNTMTNKLYKVTESRAQRRKMEQENFEQAANQALVHEGSFA